MKIFFLNDSPGTTMSCAAAGQDARARRGTGMPSVVQHRSVATATELVFRGRRATEVIAEAGIGNVLPTPLPTYVLPTTADAQGVKPNQMHVPPPLIERGP